MSLWQDVITTALVGTERRTLTLTPATNPLSQLLCQLNSTDPEATLLSAAGAISLYHRAGQRPITDNQPLPEPCPPDDKPPCSPRAAHYLKLMLQKERVKLLPEWLASAATAGYRVPDYYLPELLEVGRTSPQLRPAILPVLGQRGRWLAAHNPDWNYVGDEDIEQTWTTGSLDARRLLLQHLRHEHPASARERLVTVWQQASSDARIALLDTLQIGLNLEDEAFLEVALDDRRQEVRRQAANLLAQLPESALCQRMKQRIQSAITFRRKRNRLHLDFILPDDNDQEITRDGIDSKQPPQLLGNKAWIILQIVAATPLFLWSDLQEESPAEWIQAAKRSEWDHSLVEGWAVATMRQQNPDWAEALLPFYGTFKGYLIRQNQLISGLIDVLSAEQRDCFFLNLFPSSKVPFNSQHPAFSLLTHCHVPWSIELTEIVLDGVRRYLKKTDNPYDWSLSTGLKEFAYFMSPDIVPELSTRFSNIVPERLALASYWTEIIDEVLAVLSLRYEMGREI
ncbi:hypothetical protein MC7420_192 [Coleofasciculus chthonoplastes PCC 7420]|uniref:Uncharacterized protein n=1 Tax=Coleofasciculus chthonoplastes PCC 7420 TaxID=118168 RepID=B4VKU7_9CYAN|nr:DUF5691 domain-containing protein [Coleofasciculus chthonoplastes]EDX77055.1 hypothetical protein MC7420_192 [Coleofasciculus chthonoplastes PCC 7420]